jgi:putative transposase
MELTEASNILHETQFIRCWKWSEPILSTLKGGENIKTNRVDQTLIRKTHAMWKFIDEMCYRSKNLYNYANFLIREEFESTHKYISYCDMNKAIHTNKIYKDCMSQPANCTLRLLDKTWKSFFKAIKDWKKNKHKYLGMPKFPKYLRPNGRYPWMIPNNTCYFADNELKFRIKKLQTFKWIVNPVGRLIQVRFIPRGTCYVMEVVTEIEIPDFLEREPKRIASIDLGVNNFATITNNIGLRPIIINGKGIKSINQFYNKRRSKIVSELKCVNGVRWSNKLSDITMRRFNRIKNFMHHASKRTIDYCKENDIDTLVCGLNENWKQRQNIGNQNNQTMQSIPYDIFILQLKYKCQESGINFKTTNESYTSGTSFLDNEEPIKENYDKSRRVKRGLFKSNNGTLINADVNGSLQILRKVFPNAFAGNAFADGIEVCLTPLIINTVGI